MTNYRVGHSCPECDSIIKKIQKCKLCGKSVGMLYDLCNDCRVGIYGFGTASNATKIIKKILNFDLNDIRDLAKKDKFGVVEDRTIGDVAIFQSEKNNVSLSCTENLIEEIPTVYVSFTTKYANLDFKKYSNILTEVKNTKKELDVIARPYGDLDTINVMKDPKHYHLTEKKAFDLLKKSGKKIGMQVTIRFNNKKNTLDEIQNSLDVFS